MARKRTISSSGSSSSRGVIVACTVEPAVREALERLAREDDRSISSFVRRLIDEALRQRAQQHVTENAVA